MNRRSLFAALCAPFLARFAPPQTGRRLSAASRAKLAELINASRIAIANVPYLRAQIKRELEECSTSRETTKDKIARIDARLDQLSNT